MKFRLISFLIFIFSSFSCLAQVVDLSDKKAVAFVAQKTGFRLNLFPKKEGKDYLVEFEPNLGVAAGFSFSAFGYSVSYLTNNREDTEPQEFFGKTSYDDIRLSLGLGDKKRFLTRYYYTRYKGFYVANSSSIRPALGTTQKIIRSDMEQQSYGASAELVLSPEKYSNAAIYSHSALQDKSGGSWLAKLSIDNLVFHSKEAFVPAEYSSFYGNDYDLNRARFTSIIGSYGYAHSWVWKKSFYASAKLLLGWGTQHRAYSKLSSGSSQAYLSAARADLSAALGYNHKSFFAGTNFSFFSNGYKTQSINIEAEYFISQIQVGYRF